MSGARASETGLSPQEVRRVVDSATNVEELKVALIGILDLIDVLGGYDDDHDERLEELDREHLPAFDHRIGECEKGTEDHDRRIERLEERVDELENRDGH